MKTVLVWGTRCWVAGDPVPAEFSDLAGAADAVADKVANAPKPLRVRLVWQPRSFVTQSTRCPRGGRDVLGSSLADQYPALDMPECAWSHEPVLPIGDEFSTLIHFEREPALFDFVLRLERHGIVVDSAWPLATFLHALPTEWSESGAMTVVAVQPERALAYRHPADGQRGVLEWLGNDAPVLVGQWLAGILAKDPGEPVMVVNSSEEIEAIVNLQSALHRSPSVDHLTLDTALARDPVLPPSHPAQLLPRQSAVTAERVTIAASVALFLGAAVLGGGAVIESVGRDRDKAVQASQRAALRAEVDHLRENETKLSSLQQHLDRVVSRPALVRLLQRMSETIPPEITLSGFVSNPDSFTIRGVVAPGAQPGAWDRWRERLAAGLPSIRLESATNPGASKVLTGSFVQ